MGPYLSQPVKTKHTISGQSKSCTWAGSEMQGWRKTMEDAHILKSDFAPDVSLFGVFDGHGGREVSAYVEKHFLAELQKNQCFQQQKYEDALIQTFLKMDELMRTPEGNKEVLSLKEGDDDQTFAGCTANVALLHKNTLYVANAGDSRTILGRGTEPVFLSKDHKPDLVEEKNRIEKAGGFVSDGRVNGNLNLSRALGDLEYKQDKKLKPEEQLIIALPEVQKIELTPQDKFIIMGCDGIWETWTEKEIVSWIDSQIPNRQITPQQLEPIVETLLDKLIAPDTSTGAGCDNMTACIVVFRQQ